MKNRIALMAALAALSLGFSCADGYAKPKKAAQSAAAATKAEGALPIHAEYKSFSFVPCDEKAIARAVFLRQPKPLVQLNQSCSMRLKFNKIERIQLY